MKLADLFAFYPSIRAVEVFRGFAVRTFSVEGPTRWSSTVTATEIWVVVVIVITVVVEVAKTSCAASRRASWRGGRDAVDVVRG